MQVAALEEYSKKFQALEQRSVLVLEDNDLVASVLTSILEELGFEVLIARSALEGLNTLRLQKEEISCVLLDYGLPEFSIVRMLEQVRAISPAARILLTSGYPTQVVFSDVPVDAVEGFVPKPYNPQALVEALAKVLSIEKIPRSNSSEV